MTSSLELARRDDLLSQLLMQTNAGKLNSQLRHGFVNCKHSNHLFLYLTLGTFDQSMLSFCLENHTSLVSGAVDFNCTF